MRPGGVSPVRLCRMTSPTTGGLVTNRGNALGRAECSPQSEMGTAHFLVFEPFPYLELALVALAEIPEADAEGGFTLDLTQCDMMNEGTL